jgi:hypothetical protein
MTQGSRQHGRRSVLAIFTTAHARPSSRYVFSLLVVAGLALPAAALADQFEFFSFEETASANWSVPHQCSDGSTVQGRLLVESTRFFEPPETEDPNPGVRVQFLASCSGRSFSWITRGASASITSTQNLKSVIVTGGPYTVLDNLGTSHQVSVDVSWTGFGPLEVSVNPTQAFLTGTSMRKQRAASATGIVTFDGVRLVDGAANHFITPFIRNDEERFVTTP